MFDFFKDIYLESCGVDVEAAKKKLKETPKEERDFVKKDTRRLMIIFLIMYIMYFAFYLCTTFNGGLNNFNWFVFIRNVLVLAGMVTGSVFVFIVAKTKSSKKRLYQQIGFAVYAGVVILGFMSIYIG